MTFTLRDLISSLTRPLMLWLELVWLEHCVNRWQGDVAVIKKQRINDMAVEKIRHYQTANAQSRINEIKRLRA